MVGRNNDAKDDAVVAERAHLGCTCKGAGDETRNQANWSEKMKKAVDRILPHSILLSPLLVTCGYVCECTSGAHNGGYPSMHTAQSQHSGYSEACKCTNWAHNGGNPSARTQTYGTR